MSHRRSLQSCIDRDPRHKLGSSSYPLTGMDRLSRKRSSCANHFTEHKENKMLLNRSNIKLDANSAASILRGSAPCILLHLLSICPRHQEATFEDRDMACDSIFLLFLLFLLSSSATACGGCVLHARASYSSSLADLSAGACGYGPMALGFTGGYVAAASSAIYRGGVACGACFQVRCKNTKLCRSEGVKVILTDLRHRNGTEWVLSRPAYLAMARPGMAKELRGLGTVDVEYERIPCDYSDRNLSIRVEERSRRPDRLAIKFLFQGGQTDIVAVEVAKVGSSNWQFMSRVNGPIWSTNRAPAGSLQIRLVVTGGYDGKWVWSQKEVLPAEWRTGSVYDLGVQITDTAKEASSSS